MEMHYDFPMKWALFEEMRYLTLTKFFPHKIFSVEESTFDFFNKTYDYILGYVKIPDKEPGREYSNNYIDWLHYWKKEIST